MNCAYRDITERLDDPEWWDERAVPRYCRFHPDEAANIYAVQVALVEIACQGCERPYLVAMSSTGYDEVLDDRATVEQGIREGTLHYGDPPNTGCCSAGATMSSIPLRVVEFWERGRGGWLDWRRRPELEVRPQAPWAEDER